MLSYTDWLDSHNLNTFWFDSGSAGDSHPRDKKDNVGGGSWWTSGGRRQHGRHWKMTEDCGWFLGTDRPCLLMPVEPGDWTQTWMHVASSWMRRFLYFERIRTFFIFSLPYYYLCICLSVFVRFISYCSTVTTVEFYRCFTPCILLWRGPHRTSCPIPNRPAVSLYCSGSVSLERSSLPLYKFWFVSCWC